MHCAGLNLNLVVQAAMKLMAKSFFSVMRDLITFVRAQSERKYNPHFPMTMIRHKKKKPFRSKSFARLVGHCPMDSWNQVFKVGERKLQKHR